MLHRRDPTHSWNSWRHHCPHGAFPYGDLLETNASCDRSQPEYELIDTGVFDDSADWVVTVDYAKGGPHDLLMNITAENAGTTAATAVTNFQLTSRRSRHTVRLQCIHDDVGGA